MNRDDKMKRVREMHVPARTNGLARAQGGEVTLIPSNGARRVTPTARDERAAELITQGAKPADALRRAGFPESRAVRGMHEVSKSKSMRVALLNRICRMKDIPLPDAEATKRIIRNQLFVNLIAGGPKGSNAAAKLLGLDKDVAMFVNDQQQGNIVIVAPGGQVSVGNHASVGINPADITEQEPPADTD